MNPSLNVASILKLNHAKIHVITLIHDNIIIRLIIQTKDATSTPIWWLAICLLWLLGNGQQTVFIGWVIPHGNACDLTIRWAIELP